MALGGTRRLTRYARMLRISVALLSASIAAVLVVWAALVAIGQAAAVASWTDTARNGVGVLPFFLFFGLPIALGTAVVLLLLGRAVQTSSVPRPVTAARVCRWTALAGATVFVGVTAAFHTGLRTPAVLGGALVLGALAGTTAGVVFWMLAPRHTFADGARAA